jgi:hypothetical protein
MHITRQHLCLVDKGRYPTEQNERKILSQVGKVQDFKDETDVEWTKRHCLISLSDHQLKQFQRLHRWRYSFCNADNVEQNESGGWIQNKATYAKPSIMPERFLVRQRLQSAKMPSDTLTLMYGNNGSNKKRGEMVY